MRYSLLSGKSEAVESGVVFIGIEGFKNYSNS
jgi:hypothetical protein